MKSLIDQLGGPTAVADMLGISSQAVSQWERIPVGHVLTIYRAVGGRLSPHELRPDIYPAVDYRPALEAEVAGA